VPVSQITRTLVFERSHHRCEYCQIRDWWLEVDHIIPESRWEEIRAGSGPHDPANLAAACIACNNAKRDLVTGIDVLTGTVQSLFDPRTESWFEHFTWSDDYAWILGLTPVGRATVDRLKMNRPIYRRQRLLLRAGMQGGAMPWP
jgi:hypothetical protein